MKRIVALAFAAVVSVASLPASAADLPVKAPALMPAPPPWNWTGIYVGAQAGYARLASHIFNDSGNYTGSGFIGGATLGANWQFPNSPIVIGLEADWSWSSAKASTGLPTCAPDCETKLHWLSTIRGRLGYDLGPALPGLGPILVYVTGGVAFANVGWGQPGSYYNNSITSTGWALGGGLEGLLTGHWTWKAEYLYADFEQDKTIVQLTVAPACPSPPGFSCGDYNRIHIVRLGLNYKF